MTTASVIVCTRNRANELEGALDSLLADRPAVDWELIVVDNSSTDATGSVVAGARERADGVRVESLVEVNLGLSHARNRGIAAARGELLLFTDDDVIVEPGWVDAMCAGFTEADVVGVAGWVAPQWPVPPPRWLSGRQTGLLALTDFGDEPRDLRDDEVPVGASMATRAAAVAGTNEPFDPRLGNRGGGRFAYEEHDLFTRLRGAGRLVYRPDARVLHRIAAERMTWQDMRRASLYNGYGSRLAERLRGGPAPSRRASAVELVKLYASAKRATRRNGGHDDVDPDAAFEEVRRYWELGRRIEVVFGEREAGLRLLGRVA